MSRIKRFAIYLLVLIIAFQSMPVVGIDNSINTLSETIELTDNTINNTTGSGLVIDGISDKKTEATTMASISFECNEYSLMPGSSVSLTINGLLKDGKTLVLPNEKVEFNILDPEIAAVTTAGELTGIKKGETFISGKYQNLAATAKIKVLHPAIKAPVLNLSEADNSIILFWEQVPDADLYNIYRGMSPGRMTYLSSAISGDSYIDSSYQNGTTYFYTVTAVKGTAESMKSNVVTRAAVPSAPIIYSLRKANSIKISWTSPADAKCYTLLKSTTPGGPYSVLLGHAATNVFEDFDVAEESTYYYLVKACDAAGREGIPSNEIAVGKMQNKPVKYNADNLDNSLKADTGKGSLNDNSKKRTSNKPNETERATINSKVPNKMNKIANSPDGRVKVTVFGDERLENARLQVTESEKAFLKSLKGAVGNPVEITAGDIEINSAVITVSYDKKKLGNIKEDDLRIYWIDWDNGLLVPLGNTRVDKDNGTVSAVTSHFSTYILGGNMEVDLSRVDMIFAVDQSKSVASIDPQNKRLLLAENFIDNMNTLNKDGTADEDRLRIGLLEFADFASVKQALTSEQAVLQTSIDGMHHTLGTTKITDAVWLANQQFTYDENNPDHTRRKILVLITDGRGSYEREDKKMQSMLEKLAEGNKNVVINAVAIGNGANSGFLQNMAEITGGSYHYIDASQQDVGEQINVIYERIMKQITFDTASTPPPSYQEQLSKVIYSDKYKGYDSEEAKALYSKAHTNLLTGNFIEQASDIKINSTGPDLEILRTYNSEAGNEKTMLGNGWRLNYDSHAEAVSQYSKVIASALNVRTDAGIENTRIAVLAYGTIVYLTGEEKTDSLGRTWCKIILPDQRTGYIAKWYISTPIQNGVRITYGSGTKIVYEKNFITGLYITPFGAEDILEEVSGDYKLTRKDQSVYLYNSSGCLTSITDRYGNVITINHDAQNRITEVVDPVSRELVFEYDSSNMLVKITDPLNRFVGYEYDANGNLTAVTDLSGKKTTYTYYDSFNEDTGVFEKSKLKQITDANGHQIIKNEYDENDRLTRQYDGNGNIKYHIYKDVYKNEDGSLIPGYEILERFYIDENGNESKTVFNYVTLKPVTEMDTYGKTLQHQYYIDYDGNGQWTDVTAITDSGTEYDVFRSKLMEGNKATKEIITDKKGYQIVYETDKWGNLLKETDHYNHSIIMVYDNKNNLIKATGKKLEETIYMYDEQGVYLLKVTDPMENETVFDYYQDKEATSIPGINISLKGLLKNVTENRKNSLGDLISSFKNTQFKYENICNNRTQVIDTLGNSTMEVYDAAGRLLEITDARANTTKFEYDNMNRLTAEEDALTNRATFQYDDAGNNRFETDKNGNITEYVYDGKNQLVKVIDAAGYFEEYKYDAVGNKVQETNKKNGTTHYDYDAVNRLIQTIDPLGNTTAYAYDINESGVADSAGFNNIRVTDPLRRVTLTSYDGMYRKVKEEQFYTEQGITKKKTTDFQYDVNSNLESLTDALGKITKYEYDALNRQIRVIDGYDAAYLDGQGNFTGPLDEYGNLLGNIATKTAYDVYVNGTGDKLEKLITTDALNRTAVKESNALGQLVKITDAMNYSASYTYDAVGNLLTETDARQNTTTYQYDALNRVKKIIDATGTNYTEMEYDAVGNKSAVTDRRGNRTEYRYDSMNRLYEMKDPLLNITGYSFDESGNPLTVTDPNNNITTYAYDNMNRLVSETDGEGYTKHYHYNWAGNKTWESTRKNQYVGTQYIYDELYRLAKIVNAVGAEQTSYTYDAMGNILSKKDANGNIVTYEYDALYTVKVEGYPGDSTLLPCSINIRYDALGNPVRKESSLGLVDLYEYDELGRQISQTSQKTDGTQIITTSVTYDGNSNKLTETDGNNITRTYVYDSLNRLEASSITVSGVLQTKTFGYDANGNKTSETDWRSNTYTYVYDELNRLIEKKDPNNKIIEKLEYNADGTQSKSYDAFNNLTQYFYDGKKQLITTIDPANHTTSRTYDEDGNLKTVTDGNGNITTYEYDGLNRLTEVKNARNEITSYTYDGNGNLLTQTDGNGNTTTYEYNAANKPARKIDHGGRTGEAGSFTYDSAKTESYTYNADRTLAAKTDRNGTTTTYTCDIHGRLTSETVSGETISYTYDGNGNQLTMTDASGTTSRTYDELNRVMTKSVPYIGSSTFTYDIISGVDTGCVKETSLDPKGNLTEKVYDRAGRLWIVTTDGKTTVYSYYDNGSRQSAAYQDGSREDYTYFADNLLCTLTNKKADGTVIDTYTYEYDAAHNQTGKTDSRGSTAYTYDALNRLETIAEPIGRSTTYTYDSAGNRKTETVAYGGSTIISSSSYNEQNRLTGITTMTNGVITETTAYWYDNNGNQLTTTTNGQVTAANTYDARNQLVQTISGGTTVANAYSAEGLRVSKSVNGVLTRYLYEYDKVTLETDGSGNQTARNVYGINLLMRSSDGQTCYYMYNGHGDVTSLLDSVTGAIACTYYYDAFGNILDHTGTDSSITYAGYQYDEETGLYYLNSRMYDPKIARFLQEDTYSGDPSDPLSLNLYTYCHNEPVMYWDHSGHRATADDGTGAWVYYSKTGKKFEYGGRISNASTYEETIIEAYDLLEGYRFRAETLDNLLEANRYAVINSIISGNATAMLYPNQIRSTVINRNIYELNMIQSLLLQNSVIYSNDKVFKEILYSYFNYDLFNAQTAQNYENLLSQNPQYYRIIFKERERRNIAAGREVASFVAESIDGVDFLKGGIETIFGLDPITGNKANRLLSGISTGAQVGLPFIFGAIAKRSSKTAVDVIDAAGDITTSAAKRATNEWGDILLDNIDDAAAGASEVGGLYRKTSNTGAFKELSEPMQLKHVRQVAEEAGIGLDGTKVKIVRDPDLINKGLCGYASPKGNRIDLYPDAFTNREALVKTLGHERTHIYQAKTFGPVKDTDLLMDFERAAYGSEDSWWNYYLEKR
ncbi:MAG: RHS repeat-associated core domain-containing protein [Clostridiaceae bacterium]